MAVRKSNSSWKEPVLPASFESVPTHQTEPVAIFEMDGFVDDALYRELDATFPALDSVDYTVHDRGHKRFLNNQSSRFYDFLQRNPAWQNLYEFFDRPETFERLYQATAPHLTHRPASEQKPWVRVPPAASARRTVIRALERGAGKGDVLESSRGLLASKTRRVLDLGENLYAKSLSAAKKGLPAYLGFEFSILGDGDEIPPHNDIPEKLLSLMFYLPEKGASYPKTAGTVFYTGIDGAKPWKVWDSDMMDKKDTLRFSDEHEAYHYAGYRANALVGFVKTDVSWHSIPRLELPNGQLRRSVNINYFVR